MSSTKNPAKVPISLSLKKKKVKTASNYFHFVKVLNDLLNVQVISAAYIRFSRLRSPVHKAIFRSKCASLAPLVPTTFRCRFEPSRRVVHPIP